MKLIETIGNYKVYESHLSDILGDITSLHVFEDGKEVIREDYLGNLDVTTGSRLIAEVMMKLDIVREYIIYHNCPVVHRHTEFTDGVLLSGSIVDDETDYFLRIGDTEYYKHYLHYPTREAV